MVALDGWWAVATVRCQTAEGMAVNAFVCTGLISAFDTSQLLYHHGGYLICAKTIPKVKQPRYLHIRLVLARKDGLLKSIPTPRLPQEVGILRDVSRRPACPPTKVPRPLLFVL